MVIIDQQGFSYPLNTVSIAIMEKEGWIVVYKGCRIHAQHESAYMEQQNHYVCASILNDGSSAKHRTVQ